MPPPQQGSPRSIPWESASCAGVDAHTDTLPHVLTHTGQMLCCGQGWPFCSAFSSGCSAGCRQPNSGEKPSLPSAGGWGGVDLTSAVHYSMAVLVPFRSGCLSRGFLISNLFVSQEVQMNVGLAEGLQDTSDFDMGSQSNPIRDTHMVAAKPLRELCAGSPAPCQALPAGRWSGSSLGAAGSALDRPR